MKHPYEKLKDVYNNLGGGSVLMFQGLQVTSVQIHYNYAEEKVDRMVLQYGHLHFDTKDLWNETEETVVEELEHGLEIYTYTEGVDLYE